MQWLKSAFRAVGELIMSIFRKLSGLTAIVQTNVFAPLANPEENTQQNPQEAPKTSEITIDYPSLVQVPKGATFAEDEMENTVNAQKTLDTVKYGEKFLKCIDFIFEVEGYKTDDKNDSGGKTIWGISHKEYPEAVDKMWDMEKEASKDIAKNIYYKIYWLPINCDNYDIKRALVLFDTAVNLWTTTAKNILNELGNDFSIEQYILKRLRRYVRICQLIPIKKVFLIDWTLRLCKLNEYKIV